MNQARRRNFAIAVLIAVCRGVAIARRAHDLRVSRNVYQVLMRVMMAQGAIMRRDLDRKAANEFIGDDEMMPRFVLDGNGVFTIVRSLHTSHIPQPIQRRLKPVARARRWPAAITAGTGSWTLASYLQTFQAAVHWCEAVCRNSPCIEP